MRTDLSVVKIAATAASVSLAAAEHFVNKQKIEDEIKVQDKGVLIITGKTRRESTHGEDPCKGLRHLHAVRGTRKGAYELQM